ncbi:MAG: hypothetical protein JSU77_08550 [Fidelibacterota bacterium]|nr:MAG: hypothetical protein JSU77_08550 [Candidatus Neomarinimicrobiota bacterium]
MMQRLKYIRIMVLMLGLINPAAAQSSLEMIGFGMAPSTPDVISRGMGGIVTVPGGASEWLYSAPSSWHRIRSTQLHAAMEAAGSRLGDFAPFTRVGPQNFQFLIHVNRRTSYGIGIQPVTRVDMTVTDTDSVMLRSETLRYETNRSFEGGLSAFSIGFSRLIRPTVSLGVSLDILFGSLTQGDTLRLLDGGSWDDLFWNMITRRRLKFNGQRLALSILATVPPKSKGRLGINAVFPLTLNLVETQTYYTQTYYGLLVLNTLRHDDVGLPASVSVGYGLDTVRKHRLVVEAGFIQLLKAAKNDMIFGRHLEAARSLRLGWSRTPGGDEALLVQRLHYRMGFCRKDYYLPHLKNDPLTEFTIGAGISYQHPRFGHRVDFAFHIGRRDGLLPNVQSEDFISLSVGVTTAELWFMRPNKRWD